MKTTNHVKLASAAAAALFALGLTTACQTGTENNNADGNRNAALTTTASPATNNPAAAPTAASDAPATGSTANAGSLATPTEAYKTAYAARQQKDVAGLKRVLSKDILEFFETIAE